MSDILQEFVDFSHQLTGVHQLVSAVAAFALKVAQHRVKVIFLVVLWDLLHGWQPLGGWPRGRSRHLHRGRRLHQCWVDQRREQGAAVGFGGMATVLGAVFGGLCALVATALGVELGAGFQGVVTASLVAARWANAASWVLEVGVGGPGGHALLVDRRIRLARQMTPPAIQGPSYGDAHPAEAGPLLILVDLDEGVQTLR